MKKYLLLFLLFFFVALDVDAQSFNRFAFERPWSFALHMGPTQYFGDLYSLWKYDEGLQPDYNIAFTGRTTFGTRLKARADFTYYQISGSDDSADPRSGRPPRCLNFRARNWEVALLGEYYLKPVKIYNISREFLNPYIFAGLGITSNNPYADYQGRWVPLRPLKTENTAYPATAVVFPLGLGIKYKANVWMDVILEGNYRFTLTDYLDDISVYNLSGFYEDLIADYGSGGEGPNPDRIRLAVREARYLHGNGEPDIALIRSTKGAVRRGSGDPRLQGSKGRYDGYFSLNMGLEIYFSEEIWDYWIFKKKRRRYKFW